MLRRLANDAKTPAKIRLRAIELICVLEGRKKAYEITSAEHGDALAGLVREQPANTRETEPQDHGELARQTE